MCAIIYVTYTLSRLIRDLFVCFGALFLAHHLDSVIQRNDTGRSSALPEVVYPMRSAESHGANGQNGGSGGGIGSASVDGSRKAVNGASTGNTVAIGQSLFYTDFPPKEYGHSGK